jgi:capsular polysaccharide biosynthesis protein
MEETISLKELFQTVKKRLLLIIIITAIATVATGIVSYFVIKPVYQASTQILVNQIDNNQPLNYNNVQANVQLINTYNVIIKSPAILDKVVNELNTGLTSDQLNKEITVTSQTNSQVINLSVQDPNPVRAAQIANTTAEVFQTEVPKIMKVNNVSIIAKATVTNHQIPVKPNKKLNIVIALVVGLLAGVGVAFFLEYLDNTIKKEQDIENQLDLPVLGAITIINMNGNTEKRSRKIKINETRGESIGS